MCIIERDFIVKKGIMEEFSYYLINNKKMPQSKARIFVNLVRQFHNFVGKSYIDIGKKDILSYLFFLKEQEQHKERSLYRHLSAIKNFYEYLWNRGDVTKLPCEGVSIRLFNKTQYALKDRVS